MTTSANTPTTESLAKSLQTLPQELFDAISAFVLATRPAEVKITADYQPPLQLRLDRETREDFAAEYYSTVTFVLESKDLVRRWAKPVPKQHFKLIRRIRVLTTEKSDHTSIFRSAVRGADRWNVGGLYHDHAGKVTNVHSNGKNRVVESWSVEPDGDDMLFTKVQEHFVLHFALFTLFSASIGVDPKQNVSIDIDLSSWGKARMTAAHLAQLIQTLPQELNDVIYGLVFAPAKDRDDITVAYKPPVQLQVDRTSRQLFASTYYANTTFVFEPRIGNKWIASLTTGAFDTISSLEIHGKPGTTACQLRNSFTRMMESERLQISGADWPAYNTGLHAPRYKFAFKNASSGPLHSRWYVQWVKRVLVCEKVQS